MLHEFISSNRDDLIQRCRGKAGKRNSPSVTASELEHGVPLFLGQLVEALRREEKLPRAPGADLSLPSAKSPASLESSRTAALHGKELLASGYTVDQVVHGYGDICQSVTELASENKAPITVEEFHTFNRLLDGAIADAVSSYGHYRDASKSSQGNEDGDARMRVLADEHRRLMEMALKALYAIRTGNISANGATGNVLESILIDLRDLVEKSLPKPLAERPKTGHMTAG